MGKSGKSGKVNRAEPTDLTWIEKLPNCAELFQQAGWLNFFRKIDGYNVEVSCKFAQGLKNDMVTFNALKFKLTVELISEATGIKNEGEPWFKKLPFDFDPQRYLLPNVTPDWNKGILIQHFRKEWIEPIGFCRVMLLAKAGMLMCINITSDFFNIWWGCQR